MGKSDARDGNRSNLAATETLIDEFDLAWHSGEIPDLNHWLQLIPPESVSHLLPLLLEIDIEYRENFQGRKLNPQDYPELHGVHREILMACLSGAGGGEDRIEDIEETADVSPKKYIGNYLALRKLGEGAMGCVWLASHQRFPQRRYAIKLISHGRLGSETRIRFDREISAQGKLQHPNLVTAIDAGIDGGVPYLVMEYVPGMDLQQIITRNGPLSCEATIEIAKHIADGLQHAHEQGVIHRDLKPSNVLLGIDGLARVIDLGLASLQEVDNDLTSVNTTLGTFAYMAPEQFQDARFADIRSDIYSYACLVYCLLTGSPPFRGSPASLLQQHRECMPLPLSQVGEGIPTWLCELVHQCLAKNPADRPQSMSEITNRMNALAPANPNVTESKHPLAEILKYIVVEGSSSPRSREFSTTMSGNKFQGQTQGRSSIWDASQVDKLNLRPLIACVVVLLSISSISLILAYYGPQSTEAFRRRFDHLEGYFSRFPTGSGFLIEWGRAAFIIGLTCYVVASQFGKQCRAFFFGKGDFLRLWTSRLIVISALLYFLISEAKQQLYEDGRAVAMAAWAAEKGIETNPSLEVAPYRYYYPYSIINYSVVFCGLLACPILSFVFVDGQKLKRAKQELLTKLQERRGDGKAAIENLRKFSAGCRQLAARYLVALGALSAGIHYEYWIGRYTLTESGLQTAMMAWLVIWLTASIILIIGRSYSEGFSATQHVVAQAGSINQELQLSQINPFWFLKTTFLYSIGGITCLSLILVAIKSLLF
ncbi:MAG TPA: serine/threonine-protein kinase [Pirellulaceae bacterium]|nr:serine/threonine-protein kinase [Pirellulaceae bacterium]HMO93802.1 serine/threonine-protein kinase [Pirellulaceae bacterium]HMP70604.1 serine/threonine-protein kinase [Pirellulaceae bacterium]